MALQVFLINRNRLTTTKAMVDWLLRFDVEVVIFDNDSSYAPLLEWYRSAPVDVIRFNENFGYGVGWDTGILERMVRGDFVLSDSDLDLAGVPDDWEAVLRRGLELHGRGKSGLSIEIDDIPDHYRWKKAVVEWESHFWSRKLDAQFYDALIDTTFALFRRGAAINRPGYDAVRTERPYTAKHVPWYVDTDAVPEEEQFYVDHATGSTAWTSKLRQAPYRSLRVSHRGPIQYVADVRHSHWSGPVLFFVDGTFLSRHNGDAGRWSYSGDRLKLAWDRWPCEEVSTTDGRRFKNDRMSFEWEKAAGQEPGHDAADDLCAVIPYRESGPERRRNLETVLRYLRGAIPSIEIIVVEQDSEPRAKGVARLADAKVVFTQNRGLFNRAWGFNVGARATARDLLLFTDADILIPPAALRDAVFLSDFFDLVKPCDRLEALSDEQSRSFSHEPIARALPDCGTGMINMLCGNAVLMTRSAFVTVGGWSEEFEGWGGEDDAQECKARKLLRCTHIPGPVFHLSHPRTRLDGPSQPRYEQNLTQLRRIAALSEDELRSRAAEWFRGIGRVDKYAEQQVREAAGAAPGQGFVNPDENGSGVNARSVS